MSLTLLAQSVNQQPDAGSINNPAFKGTLIDSFLRPALTTAFFDFVIQRVVTLIFIIGTLYFFYMLTTGAISWIASGGDKQSLETAKSKITNALVGIIILFSAFAVVKFIESFFGISILTLDIDALVI